MDATRQAGPDLPPSAADGADFAELVDAHYPYVARLASRLTGYSSDAEDIVQDVFLAAYCQRDRFRQAAAVRTWLTRITINRCRSRARRQAVWRRLLPWWPKRAIPTAPTPDNAADLNETATRVRRAVEALPHKLREAVALRYLEELAPADVAEALGIARAAVDTRLARARRQLANSLGELAP